MISRRLHADASVRLYVSTVERAAVGTHGRLGVYVVLFVMARWRCGGGADGRGQILSASVMHICDVLRNEIADVRKQRVWPLAGHFSFQPFLHQKSP